MKLNGCGKLRGGRKLTVSMHWNHDSYYLIIGPDKDVKYERIVKTWSWIVMVSYDEALNCQYIYIKLMLNNILVMVPIRM